MPRGQQVATVNILLSDPADFRWTRAVEPSSADDRIYILARADGGGHLMTLRPMANFSGAELYVLGKQFGGAG